MKMKIGLWGVICISTLCACFEDKGNYTYLSNNQIDIELTVQDAVMGEEYNLSPTLDFQKPEDPQNFEYRWEVNGKPACDGKNFKYIFTGIGTFQIGFFIKEVNTGITTTRFFSVKVSSTYGKGWAILSEKDSRSSLSIIRPEKYNEDGTEKKRYINYIDLYKTLNQDELGSEPIKLSQSFTWSNSLLFVMQNGGDKCVELNGVEIKKEIKTEKEFVGEVYPPNFSPTNVIYASPLEGILSSNGNFYTRVRTNSDMFHTCAYSNEPTSYDGILLNVDQVIAPHYTKTTFILLHDNNKQRYLAMKTQKFSNAGLFLDIVSESGVNNFVDLNNTDDYKPLYGSAYYEATNKSNFINILKNSTKVQLQTFFASTSSTSSTLDISSSKQIDASTILLNGSSTPMSELLDESTIFHMLRTRPYLFFAKGSALYYYDLNVQQQYKIYHNFTSAVTAMTSNPQKSELGVGLENGEFYIFEISDTVLSDGKPKQLHFQDGLGRVVDAMYKFDSESSYSSQKAD